MYLKPSLYSLPFSPVHLPLTCLPLPRCVAASYRLVLFFPLPNFFLPCPSSPCVSICLLVYLSRAVTPHTSTFSRFILVYFILCSLPYVSPPSLSSLHLSIKSICVYLSFPSSCCHPSHFHYFLLFCLRSFFSFC